MSKEKALTVDDLIGLLQHYKEEKLVLGNTKIMIASDEEGNSYSPLMQFKSGMYNIGPSKESFVLYPSSMHTTYNV